MATDSSTGPTTISTTEPSIFTTIAGESSNGRYVTEDQINDLRLMVYIGIGVLALVVALLLGSLIGIYVWVNSLAKLQRKKNDGDPYKDILKKFPSIPRMKPIPGEELAKRYAMSTPSDVDMSPSQNNFSRNPLTSRSMVEKKMAPSVIGELNNRISGQGPRSNDYYGRSDNDPFTKSAKQDVVYFSGGSSKDRPNNYY